jgi:hypothetical protein
MTFSFSLLALLVLTALCGGLIVALAGVLMGWRNAIQTPVHNARDVIDAVGRFERLLVAHQKQAQSADAALRQDMAAIRADVEWLSGERMIEQALTMFRDGKSDRDVSQELGLPLDTVRSLNLLRAH